MTLKTIFFFKKKLDKKLALPFVISNLGSYIFRMESKYINIPNIILDYGIESSFRIMNVHSVKKKVYSYDDYSSCGCPH